MESHILLMLVSPFYLKFITRSIILRNLNFQRRAMIAIPAPYRMRPAGQFNSDAFTFINTIKIASIGIAA